ncbi:MAG: hypothetical protein ACFFCH_10265 [Promethearchaeota archaeon]
MSLNSEMKRTFVTSAFKNHRIRSVLIVAGLFAVILFLGPIGASRAADTVLITNAVVLQFGIDDAICDSVNQLVSDIDDAQRILVPNVLSLQLILRKAVGPIFYVGHGTPEGLIVGSETVSWSSISTMISNSKGQEHYFASCFSGNMEIEDKFVIGFHDIIDADVATFVTSFWWHALRGVDFTEEVLQFIRNGGLTKVAYPQRPLYYIVWTPKDIGWTPYGLYDPWALNVHYTEVDVVFAMQGGNLIDALIPILVAAIIVAGILDPTHIVAPLIIAIVTFILAGYFSSIETIATLDSNADGSIDQYIPVDPLNFNPIKIPSGPFFFRTTSWWWIVYPGTWAWPFYQVPAI